MQLLVSDASPYARWVRVVVSHYAIADINEIEVNPFENDEQLLHANPLGKIPCLILNDGEALFDSEVILRYLDNQYCKEQLFNAAELRWRHMTQFSLIKGLLDSAVALRQEQMREEEGVRSPFWTSRFEQALLRGLTQIELSSMSCGSEVTIQKMGLSCLLQYLDFRHPDLDWRRVAPATARWLLEFETLDAIEQTKPNR